MRRGEQAKTQMRSPQQPKQNNILVPISLIPASSFLPAHSLNNFFKKRGRKHLYIQPLQYASRDTQPPSCSRTWHHQPHRLARHKVQTCMTTSAKAILIIFMWSVDANATAQPATAQVGQKISAAPSACTTEEKFPSNLIPNLSAAPTQRFHIQKQPERQSTPLPEGSGNSTPPEPGS